MEKQNRQVDDFFREALSNYTVLPSDKAEEAFLKDAAFLVKQGKSVRKIYFYLSGLLLLSFVCTGIYFTFQYTTIQKTQKSPSHLIQPIKQNPVKTMNQSNSNETTIPLIASNTKNLPLTSFHKSLLNNNPAGGLQNQEETKDALQNNTLPPFSTSTSIVSSEVQFAKDSSEKTNLSVPPSQEVKEPPLKEASEVAQPKKHASSRNPRNWSIDIGGYYSPEWMFGTLEGEKYANNFGLDGTFHFGNYSIRTGAGLSITKGTNEMSINYKNFKGFYNHLDSVEVVWDATHTHLIPTYYFTKTSTWDSLLRTKSARLIKRYTYLQIPLILGYDFLKNEHVSLGLRCGPIVSFLLKTEITSNNYDPGLDKIIQINYITPDRIQTYWQFMGGINVGYSVSRKFGIEIEPDLRYYFNSVYEKSGDTKKPWSAGLRAALLFEF